MAHTVSNILRWDVLRRRHKGTGKLKHSHQSNKQYQASTQPDKLRQLINSLCYKVCSIQIPKLNKSEGQGREEQGSLRQVACHKHHSLHRGLEYRDGAVGETKGRWWTRFWHVWRRREGVGENCGGFWRKIGAHKHTSSGSFQCTAGTASCQKENNVTSWQARRCCSGLHRNNSGWWGYW